MELQPSPKEDGRERPLVDNEFCACVLSSRFFSGARGGGNFCVESVNFFTVTHKLCSDVFWIDYDHPALIGTASMAAIDSKKKTFWTKSGGGPKIPGR